MFDKIHLSNYNITMEIIYEKIKNNTSELRIYLSKAQARKNNLRIHYHSYIELSLILQGSGSYKTNDNVYSVNPGDIFFFRPNEAHCITDICASGMELFNIHIAPYYLYSHFRDAISSRYAKILASGFPLSSHKINDTLPLKTIEKVKETLLFIKEEAEQQKSDFLSLINNYISTAIILISRAYENEKLSLAEKQNYKKLLSAIQYIDLHYDEDITLEDLSESVSYSKCYLSTIFKKCMGMSLWDYITIKRIEKALGLIKTTDENILDVALQCGFNNTVNFCKAFKKYTNLSPAAFRK